MEIDGGILGIGGSKWYSDAVDRQFSTAFIIIQFYGKLNWQQTSLNEGQFSDGFVFPVHNFYLNVVINIQLYGRASINLNEWKF